ncbi:uncharacterized protein BKA78DRAFT_318105 [Phyllosticta capitalensis]|uniref:uncharacterized protein n=1 Tax=Phyllosticta capitalensis TaxID=121624 RepID=UPI00312E47FC
MVLLVGMAPCSFFLSSSPIVALVVDREPSLDVPAALPAPVEEPSLSSLASSPIVALVVDRVPSVKTSSAFAPRADEQRAQVHG